MHRLTPRFQQELNRLPYPGVPHFTPETFLEPSRIHFGPSNANPNILEVAVTLRNDVPMPSILPLNKLKKEDHVDNQATKDNNVAPPPAYTSTVSHGQSSVSPLASGQGAEANDNVDISAAFANLSLHSNFETPNVDTCIAHLKLLFAFQSMKEDVGYTDGLWNIWDSRADSDVELSPEDLEALGARGEKKLPDDERKLKLSKIREKRWALFVARAVDRYESWWASLPQTMLREDDMNEEAPSLYHDFVTETNKWPWTSHMLPPLDVLMV